MRQLMKAGLFNTLLLTSFLHAVTYETPVLYKDARSYGMGATGVASGGSAASVLLNPAGLAKIQEDITFDFSLLHLNVGSNSNVVTLALNGVSTTDYSSLISDSIGQNINLYANDYSYVAMKAGAITLSAGYAGSYNNNIKVHSGFGASGLAELDADIFYAPILSTSFSLFDILHIGASYKYMTSYSVEHSFSLSDVTGGTFNSDVSDLLDYEGKTSTGNVIDAGILFDMEVLHNISGGIRPLRNFFKDFKPSLGVSVLNIGGYSYDKYVDGTAESTSLPQTINIGLSMMPKCSWFEETVLTFEMHDILMANDIAESRGYYGMFRAGLEGYYFKSAVTDLALRAGWYNGAYSAGLDYRFLMLHIGAITYVEELGGTIGMDQDRRYMLNIDLSF
jgi:hypothetical protein